MNPDLPPGVSVDDIPGNRPEDIAWECVHADIDVDCDAHGLCDRDAAAAWSIGLSTFLHLREMGAQFPHDPHQEKP